MGGNRSRPGFDRQVKQNKRDSPSEDNDLRTDAAAYKQMKRREGGR